MHKFLVAILLLTVGCQSDNTKKVEQWKPELRISSQDDFTTLDPRQVRDLPTVTALHLLYEGLTRKDPEGNIEPGIAAEWNVSPDLLTYTFSLRNAVWNNGDPVTAQDFAETWKSILSPRFAAPNAYQLYIIKGAKEAKDGKLSLDDVAIYAKDSQTLEVQLQEPTPYFLELVSTHFFYPVHQTTRDQVADALITNGPFQLHHQKHHNELGVERNPKYWDNSHVKLNTIAIVITDENTALNMFHQNKLDWVGSPLSTLPPDSLNALKNEGRLQVASAAGTHWFRVNTARAPFDNQDVRRAFGFALNRQEIVDHITQGNQKPAVGIVPLEFGINTAYLTSTYNEDKARKHFARGLEKKQISAEEFPVVTITYASSERNHKIAQAIQEQWQNLFHIQVKLDATESQIFFEKLKKKDYQLAIGSWYADFRDPINFLEVFKYSKNSTNNTQWESPLYIALLDLSQQEKDPRKRLEFLSQAEGLLIEEMPVIPLFYGSYNYLKKDRVKDVYLSDLGYLDFKHASVE